MRLRLANPCRASFKDLSENMRDNRKLDSTLNRYPMLHLLHHPLAAHVVTHLRDRTTKPATFRTLAYQISLLLALEATRDLGTREKTIQTPLEPHSGRILNQPIVLVPILRAGIAMVQPFTDLFPDVSVGYIGLERDEQTAVARSYYCKLPPFGSKRCSLSTRCLRLAVPLFRQSSLSMHTNRQT